MLRTVKLLALAAFVLALSTVAQARPDDKEVTLKGDITCAKCDLKMTDKCATVIKVDKNKKDKDSKDTVYYFDTDSHKKYHGDICKTPKKGSVTGTVSEKDGKKTVKVSKLDYDEKDK